MLIQVPRVIVDVHRRNAARSWLAPTEKGKKKPDQKAGLFISEAAGLDQLLQLRDGFEQVRHQAVIGHLEDRRFFVLVDRNDHFGVFHTGQMLDRAGNTDRNVQLWRNDFAGLTDNLMGLPTVTLSTLPIAMAASVATTALAGSVVSASQQRNSTNRLNTTSTLYPLFTVRL